MEKEERAKALLLGSVSGLATCVALQPIDLLRTRMQETPATIRQPRIVPIIRSIYRQDGITGLWRGTVPSLWRVVPGTAIFFASLSHFRYLIVVGYHRKHITNPLIFDPATRRFTIFGNLLVGAAARSTASFIMMPMTVVKTRFEGLAYRKQYETTMGTLSAIWASEGLRGLWRGWGLTMMRDAPYAGLVYGILEGLKPILGEDLKGKATSSLLAGLSATFLTTPFDAIRTRVQLRPTVYPAMIPAFARIARDEGISGFYRGALPRMVKKTLGSAISWSIFDQLFIRKNK